MLSSGNASGDILVRKIRLIASKNFWKIDEFYMNVQRRNLRVD